MKLIDGNKYVCTKECKDTKGRKMNIGAICHVSNEGLLYGYNDINIYSQVEPLEDYGEYFVLYEESPYNIEERKLREEYAGRAMQTIIMASDQSILKHKEMAAEDAVAFAYALIEQLKK